MSGAERRTQLLMRLELAYNKLAAAADDPDIEGAHVEGDSALVDALRALADYHGGDLAIATTVSALAIRFDELSPGWWYA